MILVMDPNAGGQVGLVVERLESLGYKAHVIEGVARTVIGAVGQEQPNHREILEGIPGVERVVPIMQPYKLVSSEWHPEPSVIHVRGVDIGAGNWTVMSGPCAVESEEQLLEAARAVKAAGAHILRGGAYKPRTSPYDFQGMEEEGLKLLAKARQETGLPVVTEVVNPSEVPVVAAYADILQIGARNMQNFILLREVGRSGKPVMLKRGLSATIQEWLMAAEYIMAAGNESVILCERGIRTYETATRNTLDLSAVALARELSHLPIIVDPSHGTGKKSLVGPMARGAMAVGADGVIIEVHPNPAQALSDGPQSLNPVEFRQLMNDLMPLMAVCGKTMGRVL